METVLMTACTRVDRGYFSVGSATDDADDPDPSRSPDRSLGTTPTPHHIELVDATGRLDMADAGWLHARLAEAFAHLGAPGEVRVRVIDDAEMDKAHQRYSGVAGTTDVLTFDLAEGASHRDGAPLDVDLLLCLDEADRQAAERGHREPRRELLLYALHGVLHCLGEDDHTPEGFAAMHAREDAVLRAIGVGAIFSAEPTTRLDNTHAPEADQRQTQEGDDRRTENDR